jgi:glycosyltransferase involved in cell wall biosynthesis
MPLKACTIVARNYLAQAKVLAASFKAHHPMGEFSVLVVDDASDPVEECGDPFKRVRPKDIGLSAEEIGRMAMIYNVTEFCAALKPWFLRQQLGADSPAIIYLDPDIEIFSPMDDIFGLAKQHGIVLTPHSTDPIPHDDLRVSETDILGAGVYNLGFLGLGPGCGDFLDWWSERLQRECLMDQVNMRFTDQRWIDFVPCMYGHHILKDPTCNVAHWNVHSRKVTWTGERYEVNGLPLRFFHYSGFDPDEPHLLNKHLGDKPRTLLSREPGLERLYREYVGKLENAGFTSQRKKDYGYGRLENGIQITPFIRKLYRESLRQSETNAGPLPPVPFVPGGAEAFVAWLNEPVFGGCPHFTRYLQSIHASRPDVQQVYPYPANRNAQEFINWVFGYGQREHDIPDALMPAKQTVETNPANQSAISEKPVPVVDIVGYLQAELGLGEAARLLISGIKAAGIRFNSITFRDIPCRQNHPFQHTGSGDSGAEIKILCINCEHMPSFMRQVSPGFLEGRHIIGVWFWEIAHFPQGLLANFDFVDEVWVASEFIAEVLRKVSSKPIFAFPLPVFKPRLLPSISKAELGLPDRYIFYFSFDFFSTIGRKNPLGLIGAFKKAFAPEEGPVLVIKSINGDKKLADLEKLRYEAAERSDILIMDRYLSLDHKDAMMASCDCYVSLHRGEGFGLTMAEAMSLAKPVIATRYSGNLDFMSEENSYLCSHIFRPVGKGSEPYPEAGEWAEPDIAEAASLMRHVYEHPDEAAERGKRAQLDIGSKQSPEACGRFVSKRLAEINATRFRAPVAARADGKKWRAAWKKIRGRFPIKFRRASGN